MAIGSNATTWLAHEVKCALHSQVLPAFLEGEPVLNSAITPTPQWGCYDEYKKRHDELWPELSEVLSQNGIDMVIYRHEDLLFVYGTAPSQEAWDAVEKDSVTPRWNEYMAEVLKSNDDGELIVHDLPQAFAFGNLT